MTIDPQVLRAEQHVEIGRVIARDAERLIDRWSRRAVAEQPHAARLHHETLRDELPAFLRMVAGCLAASSPDATPHCVSAAEHGRQRWESGWSLPEVVRDYQILRLVLFEHLEGELNRPLLTQEVQAIGLALDEAITAAVSSYVREVARERAELEASLRSRAEALHEADRRKNEFLAVLAHELRNPLAPILNSVEVLRLIGPGDGPVTQARGVIERQVRQMVRLVDDLLDVTRIAQDKLQLRRTTFDLAAAVAEAVQTTAPLFEARRHRLTVTLPPEPLRLEADHARIVQVMVNLLTNAAKYTDPGGQVRLTGMREGGEVVLRVRDNGLGIEPDMLDRVFDLFTQSGRALGHAQGGLGIGLTLVRRLIELHDGRISVRSDGAGQGSEFEVRLPAPAPAAAPALPPSAPSAQPVDPRHILVIEDNADTRSTMATLLGLLGHRVETAGNGSDGLARARDLRPQVALVDIGLPHMDGYEVARRLRAELGGDLLLLALTGHALEEDRQRALAAGFDAHLVKPIQAEELNRLLAARPDGPAPQYPQ